MTSLRVFGGCVYRFTKAPTPIAPKVEELIKSVARPPGSVDAKTNGAHAPPSASKPRSRGAGPSSIVFG